MHVQRFAMMALLSCIGCAQAQTVPTFPDLVYANVGGQPLRLDLYLLDGSLEPRPLLVWIHGGGTRFPAPGFATQLRNRGVAVA